MKDPRINNLCFLIILLFPFLINAQNFRIDGDYEGSSKTEELTLSYFDLNDNYISRTFPITNKKFEISGTLNGVQRVIIKSNLYSGGMEDHNLGYFFIEPGQTDVKLEENEFKNIVVKGSRSQSEYEEIIKITNPIYHQIKNLSKNDSNKELVLSKLDTIKNFQLNYAYSNPRSYVSAYLVDFHSRTLPKDSLRKFYSAFSDRIKVSIYGNAIGDLLGENGLSSGMDAPNFISTDINGEAISLGSFEGKYLLIDFWAGWCVPCIKNLPDLKEIDKQFHNKGLEILGVSFDESREKWRTSVSDHEVENWKQIYVGLDNIHKKGSISSKYEIQPIPAYILIDKNGKIIGRYLNASSDDKDLQDLQAKLDEIFK